MNLANYFQSYDNYFWEWDTDFDFSEINSHSNYNVIQITGGGTIVYRPYLQEILNEMSLIGLPPFGALLLVLFAMKTTKSNLSYLFDRLQNLAEFDVPVGYLDELELVKTFLENLVDLDPVYKQNKNLILLLQTIFKDSHALLSVKRSQLTVEELKKNDHIIADIFVKSPLNRNVVSRDIHTIALLIRRFPTTYKLEESMKITVEIEEIQDEIVEEETTTETTKNLIDDLVENEHTFQVGSLIKRIWSGLKIPTNHLSPGEHPIGGISDLTNKGDLSRIILTEFANDEDLFINRVANNEALYIQREIPPEENHIERIVLLDTSLKNWGIPKILSFAISVAIVHHPKSNNKGNVYVLGQESVRVNLDNVEEIIESLYLVSPVLDVADSLENFLKYYHNHKNIEVFFISHKDNFAQPKLQKIIHEYRHQLKYLITTTSQGEIQFLKQHKGNRKFLQKMILPLQELWENPPKNKSKQNKSASTRVKNKELPLNYPILFSIPLTNITSFIYEGEFYILSNKKQLLNTYLSGNYYDKSYYNQYDKNRGAEVLFENISIKPKGLFALAQNKQQQFILCQYLPNKKTVSKLNLNTKEYYSHDLMNASVPVDVKLVYFNKLFYLLNDDGYILSISIEGDVSTEKTSIKFGMFENISKAEKALNNLNFSKLKIISNFNKIAINEDHNLVVSNYELIYENNSKLIFGRNSSYLNWRSVRKGNQNIFEDGSIIVTDSRGMLTFISSNHEIPTFYIPSTLGRYLAVATEFDFGGSDYYMKRDNNLKTRTMSEMYENYIGPFISQIIAHGTED